MDIITKRPRERQCNADGELPQLLDSPLPTPRRSCASADAPSLRCRPDASPLRTQVPFSWESSPGVPKSSAWKDVHKAKETLPPKPPPGRGPPCPARNWCYGNAVTAANSDDDDTSFSDALDRISSERIGSFDRVTSKRFEDIFVGRARSFVKDRSRHAHAAADGAVAASSSEDTKHWRRLSTRLNHDSERPTSRQSDDPVQVQLVPRVEQMSPRACGLMVFFPGARNPQSAGSGDRRSTRRLAPAPAILRPPTAAGGLPYVMPCRRERQSNSGRHDLPQQPRGEKRSREEWQSRGWGVSSLLDTSKKYCTDARKALSKLSIGLGTDSGSPRVGRERSSGKHDVSTMPAMAAKLTQLKTSRN